MKKRVSVFSALGLGLALLLCGCGTSRYSAGKMAETAASTYYDMGFSNSINGLWEDTIAPEAAPVPYAAVETAAAMEMEAAYDMEEGALTTSPQETLNVAAPDTPLERKLIRNMDLTVETTDFDPLIEALQQKTAEFQGYIEQSDISGNSITNQGRPSRKYAHMTLRIPADRLDAFISQVEASGNITYKSENVSDVTLQYSDIESRLKTLRMEQDRLWELLAQADTTESIVLLEERLTEVSSEIESCESRMRYLDNSVTYSTVYLSINEVDMESPTKPETAWQQIKRGFTRNLITLMDSLTMFFINLLSSLPVLLFLAVLVFLAVQIIRRIIKHRNPKAPKEKTPKKQKNSATDTAEPAQTSENHADTAKTAKEEEV